MATTLPCPFTPQKPPSVRPPWFLNGVPVVDDPQYGLTSLTACPAPLSCFKSAELPDGSYWMWLGGPWYGSKYSPLSGMLFFAVSWERWILLAYVSMRWGGKWVVPPYLWQSTWAGIPGTGRMIAQQVTIAAPPTGTGQFEMGTET